MIVKYKDETFEIKKDEMWELHGSKILKHTTCLKIAEHFKLNMGSIDFVNQLVNIGGVDHVAVFASGGDLTYPVIGEASATTLKNKSMVGYIYTMAYKRCIDRVILRLTGLYHQGFYSDSEINEAPPEKEQGTLEIAKKVIAESNGTNKARATLKENYKWEPDMAAKVKNLFNGIENESN